MRNSQPSYLCYPRYQRKENEMQQNRTRNALLSVVAALLLFNLGVMLSRPVHALGKTQYKDVLGMENVYDAVGAQRVLDQQSAEGWEYVGAANLVLIFKK
jgi:hypothetical protein